MDEKEKSLLLNPKIKDYSKEILNPINLVKNNLNVLKNSFADIKEVFSKYEYVLDQLPDEANKNSTKVLRDFEKFKEKIEIDSIFSDVNQAVKESIYLLAEIEKYISSSELITNVELN